MAEMLHWSCLLHIKICVKWGQLITIIFPFLQLIANHGMKNMMTDICTYLHDSGTIIWLHESDKLRDFVFLRPRWLIDIIKTLVRNDIHKLEYDEIEDILIPRAVLRSRSVL